MADRVILIGWTENGQRKEVHGKQTQFDKRLFLWTGMLGGEVMSMKDARKTMRENGLTKISTHRIQSMF